MRQKCDCGRKLVKISLHMSITGKGDRSGAKALRSVAGLDRVRAALAVTSPNDSRVG